VDALAVHFLEHYAARYRKPLTRFDEAALALLRAHSWPGNVRELAHAVERAVLMADPAASAIAVRDLAIQPLRTATDAVPHSLEDAERAFIERVLAQHGGDVRQAAQQLGMSRSALYRRLQQYGVRE
jgi:DNA-binding NtrC family response regulator